MMRFFIGLVALFGLSTASALTLNGTAQFSKLSTPLYLAALSLPSKNHDAKHILQTQQWQRMDLYVLRSEWRPRQWQRQWLNDISISTSPNQLAAIKHNVQAFAQLLPAPLIKNDHVRIEYYPGKGTQVSINATRFLQTEDDRLFKSLLRVWIGELPPSRLFKSQVLGEQITDHGKRFINEFTLAQTRIDAARNWKRKREENERFLREKRLQLAAINSPLKNLKKPVKSIPKPRYSSLSAEQKQTFIQNYYLKDLKWRIHKRIFDSVDPPVWITNKAEKGAVLFTFNMDRKGNITQLTGKNDGIPIMLVADVHRAIKRETPQIAIPALLQGNNWQIELRFPIKQTLADVIQPPKKPGFMLSSN